MGIYISFGSNIDPAANVLEALKALRRALDVRRVSTVYETPPLNRPEQQPFYNGVLQVDTDVEPWELKHEVLRGIEADLGRVRSEDKYAARSIDLDILLYRELVIDRPGLTIPDPDVYTRPFLAVPLHELAGNIRLPGTGQPLSDIVASMNTGDMSPLNAYTDLLRREATHGSSQG